MQIVYRIVISENVLTNFHEKGNYQVLCVVSPLYTTTTYIPRYKLSSGLC